MGMSLTKGEERLKQMDDAQRVGIIETNNVLWDRPTGSKNSIIKNQV